MTTAEERNTTSLNNPEIKSQVIIDFIGKTPDELNSLLGANAEAMKNALTAESKHLDTVDYRRFPLKDSIELIFNDNQMKISIFPDFTNRRLGMQWTLYEKEESMEPEGVSFWGEIAGGSFTNLVIDTRGDGLTFIESDGAGNKICSHIFSDGQVKITA